MKKVFTLPMVLLITLSVFAQAPLKMSYQCIVRDASGVLVTNHSVGIKISILQGSTSGNVAYQETYNPNPQTNANGLISIEIGNGLAITGAFSTVNWAVGPYFLKTETDPTGGTNYTIVGTSQLLSVPYALYAKTAGNSFSGNYYDLTNKPILFDGIWTSLTGKPTTISGYGITDAVNTTGNQTIGGIKTFIKDLSINGLTIGRGNGAISNNAAFGNQALYSNTTGSRNTATGTQVLFLNTTGYNNTATGYAALYFNTSGYNNTASGYAALYSNTTGYENTANGRDALGFNTTGFQNTAAGFQALLSNTIGYFNTANGYKALYSNTNGSANTANGMQALYSNTSADYNTANGYGALWGNTTGDNNTAIGSSALLWNTTGTFNTATGVYALGDNTTGNRNTANGVYVLRSNTTGSDNTGNGWEVLYFSTGDRITANGSHALYSNTTGSENTATGFQALNSNTTGSFNTAVGSQALNNNSTGNNNTAIGNLASARFPGMNNATAIGSGAIVNASNNVRIGNTDVSVIEGQVAFTSASDLRLKKNIKNLTTGLDFITKLRPVEYQMKKGDDKINYGFIAQDIEKLVGTNNSLLTIGGDADRTLGLRYSDFIAPMVKALQEQQVTLREQQKEIDELKELVKSLMKN